jgi:hypothetical protein
LPADGSCCCQILFTLCFAYLEFNFLVYIFTLPFFFWMKTIFDDMERQSTLGGERNSGMKEVN